MIRIQAIGGLGNQLFIWNLAHYLEDKFDTRIVIYFPETKSDRKCEIQALSSFCKHRIKIIEDDSFNNYMNLLERIKNKNSTLSNLIDKIFGIHQTNLPSESFKNSGKKPRIVRGYFQSPDLVSRNFHLYSSELNELTRNLIETSVLNEKITDTSMIFHIRRGDFIKNSEKVGLLKLEYFKGQIEPDVTTVIFTDADESDSEFANFFNGAMVFGELTADTWTSFAFMSFAKKLVASNSTFSWWAGFLAQKRGAFVVAPSPWTRTPIYGQGYLSYEGFSQKKALFYGDDK